MMDTTTKATHTPGPWRVTAKGHIEGPPEQGDYRALLGRVARHRFSSADRVPKDEEQAANARLIAEAPALHALVARLMEQADENAKRHKGALDSDQATARDIELYDAWYETLTDGFDARALLARIEGVTP